MPLSLRRRSRTELRGRWFIPLLFIGGLLVAAVVYLLSSQVGIVLEMQKARQLFEAGQHDQALQALNTILSKHINYPPAIDAVGAVYLAQGDLVKAEIKYQQALKQGLKPNTLFNHGKIGSMYLSRGMYQPAELESRHALELSPKNSALLLQHALSLHGLGQLTAAVDSYRKVLALEPDQKLAQQKLAQAKDELERGFINYIYDRAGKPLARYPALQNRELRFYGLAQYAAHLIGYLSAQEGAAGLERALQPYLPGNEVTLTIDANWQLAADRAMGWHKGALVALNPQTGEIMAAVNHPSFDPHLVEQKITKYLRNKNEPLKNRALQGLYKPGSIFKIITAAAALETGIDIDRIFPVECRGAINYSEKTFWCWRRHNRVDSLQAALDTSCNIGMAEVGFALGPDRLFEYSNKFGFGAPLTLAFESSVMELNYPVASSRAPMVSDIRFDLADRSCGLGEDILISPLHAAMLAAAVANQGRMMQPYFVKEIKNVQGKILGQGVPLVWRTPILPETAEKLKAFMVDAVLHGIGQKARIPGMVVAGKTGTTGDSKLGLNGWMICFAPADNPQVALAVYAEKEGTGMDMAAPIAKSFMEAVLKK